MFTYNKVSTLNVTSKHATTFESFPKLRDEDISFYGLIAWAAGKLGEDYIMGLPGVRDFEFTDRDRAITRTALKAAGVRREESSSLEVCTIRLGDRAELIASDFYTLGGSSKHGLEIMNHSTGVCTAQQEALRGLDNRS